MRAKVTPVSVGDLDRYRPLWEELETRAAACSPFETFAWQRAWVDVYEPRGLRLVEIERRSGEVVGLALIENDGNGRWRFAGAPGGGARGMLCPPGAEQAAWRALVGWLRRNRGEWTMLEAVTAPEVGTRLRGARVLDVPVLYLDLPHSFDDYLAARSSRTRKRMRQRMRKLERHGGEIRPVATAQRPAALRDMVRLHGERAAFKGEIHDDIDDRLARLLDVVADVSGGPGVRVTELVVDGERAGVNVRIDHRGTAYSYSDGISVDRLDLSPGILLDLKSIRDAIDRGIRRYDLGPGEYDYKYKLGAAGGQRQIEAEIVSPTARGMLARARLAAVDRARSIGWAARAARWMRYQARNRQTILPVPVVEQIVYWGPLFPYGRTPIG